MSGTDKGGVIMNNFIIISILILLAVPNLALAGDIGRDEEATPTLTLTPTNLPTATPTATQTPNKLWPLVEYRDAARLWFYKKTDLAGNYSTFGRMKYSLLATGILLQETTTKA